jgi:hypothetical protein
MVLASRIRRSGLGLPGGRVVVVVGAGAGRSEVADATAGGWSRRAAVGACLADVQPMSTAASTAKLQIRRNWVISGVVPRGGGIHNLVGGFGVDSDVAALTQVVIAGLPGAPRAPMAAVVRCIEACSIARLAEPLASAPQ